MATKKENEGENEGGAEREAKGGEESQQQQEGSSDLKEREYRDKDGNIHHHTRTSKEMQEKE